MKLSGSALKNIDYKQLGINHGEKVVIALVGLMIVWALWGTNWQRFKKKPTELVEQATTAKEAFAAQAWPVADQKALAGGTDLVGKIDQLLTPIDGSKYAMTTTFFPPLHPEKKRITKPRYLPVEKLIADSGWVYLQLSPNVKVADEGFTRRPSKEALATKDKDRTKKAGPKKPKAPEEEATPEELKPRANTSAKRAASTLTLGGMNLRGSQENVDDRRKEKELRRNRAKAAQEQETDPATARPATPKLNGGGYRFVAVRGIFPLKTQVDELKRAQGDVAPSAQKHNQDLVQFYDFALERQTKRPGPDPWGGQWEPVDRGSVIELLKNEISDFAPETLAAGIVDSAICMPYPDRLVGEWGLLASHPAVKSFALTPEEVEEQVEYQRRVIDRMKAEEDKQKAPVNKKGFADVQRDMRYFQARARNMQTDTGKTVQEQILEDLTNNVQIAEPEIRDRLKKFVIEHTNPINHLVLFRYLDLTVKPGNEYRYRVQLILRNPFHDRHAEDVEDPSLTVDEVVKTEFSEPTPPVLVKDDARFYIGHVDNKLGKNLLPTADLDLYQWFASTGTIVNRLARTQLGQFVGGKDRAKVLRPAEPSLDMEGVPFYTNDMLVDMSGGFSLDQNLHGDLLKALASAVGKKTTATIPDEVLITDENGSLELLDAMDQSAEHSQIEKRFKQQNDAFKKIVSTDEDDSSVRRLRPRFDRGAGKSGKKGGRRSDPRRKGVFGGYGGAAGGAAGGAGAANSAPE